MPRLVPVGANTRGLHELTSGICLLPALLFLAGCQSQLTTPTAGDRVVPVPVAAGRVGASPVVFVDPQVQALTADVGDRSVVRPDGRLHVEVDLKSLAGSRLQVQLQCVFLDEQGLPTADETPWETLFLTENSTETVPFDSLNPLARTFTVRLRVTR